MVKPLTLPVRPLSSGGKSYFWSRGSRRWQWCRVYHREARTPRGDAARTFGPLARFDPHTPNPAHPAVDPTGRSVLYVGDGLATSACEVFGETGEALICPSWRVALLEPITRLRLLDLVRPGSAMAIGALPTLGDGDLPRSLTQEWARAIYEDHPLGAPAGGIRYRSAFNAGIALALWDTTGKIRVLVDGNGTDADAPLNHPGMLIRLKTLLVERQIVVRTIPHADCPRCTA